jgi:two-component system sensor histidine kinase SenX3
MSPQRREQNAELEQALAKALHDTDTAVSQRDQLLSTLDELREGVLVLGSDGREVYRNRAAERYREARHSDAVVAAALDALVSRALTGERCEREQQVFGPPRAVVHLAAVPIGTVERPLGVAAFVSDVSETHRIESVRRDFVANVSHELKTPIGALEVLAETLVAEEDPAVTRPLAERIVKEAERLARIVDDLLDLSTIEAQEAPTRGPMPVRLLISESVDVVQAAADAAEVPLLVGPEPPDLEIFCDVRQLRSALVNLLDNAIKYSGPSQPVEIGACILDDRIAFVVRDHGIGIPTRDLERIWERFYRVDRARSRDTGGTGLGLAIVRHVAQAHGGEVTVQSREGEGSIFTLSIPLANGSARGITEVPTTEDRWPIRP